MNADCPATTAYLVYNGQARSAMLVKFTARFFNWLIRTTTSRHGSHDLSYEHFRSAAIISRHAATHVTLGDDADKLEAFFILNHRRAATV